MVTPETIKRQKKEFENFKANYTPKQQLAVINAIDSNVSSKDIAITIKHNVNTMRLIYSHYKLRMSQIERDVYRQSLTTTAPPRQPPKPKNLWVQLWYNYPPAFPDEQIKNLPASTTAYVGYYEKINKKVDETQMLYTRLRINRIADNLFIYYRAHSYSTYFMSPTLSPQYAFMVKIKGSNKLLRTPFHYGVAYLHQLLAKISGYSSYYHDKEPIIEWIRTIVPIISRQKIVGNRNELQYSNYIKYI